MAIDESLARSLGPDQGVLRIYSWSDATLSLGRNQAARERYKQLVGNCVPWQVVRRPTGGREVLHELELTYSLALPARALGGPRATYRAINEVLLSAVRSLGAPAYLVRSGGPCPGLEAGACFGTAVGGEIGADGRKLVGSAQVRLGEALLQHGSLLLEPPTEGPQPLRLAGVSLSELLPRPVSFSDAAEAVESAASSLGGAWRRDDIGVHESSLASRLVRHYESSAWTWRK